MKEIIFTNVSFLGNAGDYWSSPLKYYNFDKFKVRQVHFIDFWEKLNGNENFKDLNTKDSLVVIGGGGLLTTQDNFIQKTTEHLIENNKVILWGIGSNTQVKPAFEILKHENILLHGIRDTSYNLNYPYLPCPSCKHILFDKKYEEVDEIGIIEHPRLPIDILNIDKITNKSSIDDILNFIGSKKIIISSTYHGVYWAQLMNKKVIYYSESNEVNSKIINLKHRVNICNKFNYMEKIQNISHCENLLEESRKLNDEFYKKVINIFEKYQ